MIQQFFSQKFLLFVFTSGSAAVVNFSARIIYNIWVDFSTAVILAYITGMLTAFVLAKCFVFKESQQALHRSAMFFTLVNLVAVLQTWVISISLAYYILPTLGVTLFTREIAHGIGIVVPAFTSYIGHKQFSFR